MKRFFLIILTAFLVNLSLSGETVLLFTTDNITEESKSEEEIIIISAVEDGVLNTFFNYGHIISTAGKINEEQNIPAIPCDRLALRTAKSGGATLLLEIELACSTAAGIKLILPESAGYKLITVISDEIIVNGSFRTETFNNTAITPYEVCFNLGQAIAEAALSNLSL